MSEGISGENICLLKRFHLLWYLKFQFYSTGLWCDARVSLTPKMTLRAGRTVLYYKRNMYYYDYVLPEAAWQSATTPHSLHVCCSLDLLSASFPGIRDTRTQKHTLRSLGYLMLLFIVLLLILRSGSGYLVWTLWPSVTAGAAIVWWREWGPELQTVVEMRGRFIYSAQ